MKSVIKRASLWIPLAFGCSGGPALEDGRHPTGSQAIGTSSDYSALYVANAAEGTVARVDLSSGTVASLLVDGEPTRVARAGRRVFVSLRASRQVAVLEDDGARLVEVKRIGVGREPFGVVANELGTRVYVASSLSNTIQEIDVTSLEVIREIRVGDEPRWLALHPGGNALYAGGAWRGSVFYVDLTLGTVERTQLPEVRSFSFDVGEGEVMARRITGDMAVNPKGDTLVIPTMYEDNATTVEEEPDPERFGGGYGSPGRMNPSITVVEIDGERPKTSDGLIVPTAEGGTTGYPSSVTVSPDGELAVFTIEGEGRVHAFEIEDHRGDRGDETFADVRIFEKIEPRLVFESFANMGARGIAFVSNERAFSYGFIDRTVQELNPNRDGSQVWFELGGLHSTVAQSNLSPDVELGRMLFYAANEPRISMFNAGLSCATCHFDARTDGLSWAFEGGRRQTPSLAGRVSLTAPVRWEGDAATVAADAMRTSQGLMGGEGLTTRDAEAIAAFIDSTRDVDSPRKGMDDPAVTRGKVIFDRADVGCAGCHSGERHTDNQVYAMFGLDAVKTRSLTGVAGSPPYLHDGSAPTLYDVVLASRSRIMGDTSMLSEAELQDLVAYLESL
jgi:YVTN family beta-propeller protein